MSVAQPPMWLPEERRERIRQLWADPEYQRMLSVIHERSGELTKLRAEHQAYAMKFLYPNEHDEQWRARVP